MNELAALAALLYLLRYDMAYCAGVVIGFMAYAPAPVVRYVDMSGMSDGEIMRMVMRQM